MKGSTKTKILLAVLSSAALACSSSVLLPLEENEAKKGTETVAAPSASTIQIEHWDQFVADRGYALQVEDQVELHTAEVPFNVINKLLAIKDGIVLWDNRVLVMSRENQMRFREVQERVATHEELVGELAKIGIHQPPPTTGQMKLKFIGPQPVDPSGVPVPPPPTPPPTSTSTSTATPATSTPVPPPKSCELVATVVASAKVTWTRIKTVGGDAVTTQYDSTSSNTSTPWNVNNSTFAHIKHLRRFDDQGSAANCHNYYSNITTMLWQCWQGTAYPGEDWTDEVNKNTRSLGGDSGEQSVTYTITVNPKNSTTQCDGWSATVSNVKSKNLVTGKVYATNNGISNSQDQSSVYSTITPHTFMELNRPPQTCTVPTWNSNKKFSTTATVNFNLSSATTSESTSGGEFKVTGGLKVEADGVKETGPQVTGSGNMTANGSAYVTYLTKTNSSISGGSGTVAFEHDAHPPTSYTFAPTMPSCNTIAGEYRAGFGGYTSNTSKAGEVRRGVTSTVGCPNNIEIAAFDSNVTVQSTLDVSALACSCLIAGGTCSVACGALAAPAALTATP